MMYASGFFPLVSAVQRNSAAAAAAAALGCGGRPGGLDSADIDVDGDSDDNSVADIEIRPHHDDEDGDRRRRNGIYFVYMSFCSFKLVHFWAFSYCVSQRM